MNSTFSSATTLSQSSATQLPPTPTANKGTPTPGAQPNPASANSAWGSGRLNFYWCTSCETRFKRKYDWKRHEEEFHERWKKYPCPEPGCNRSFWGANTFNQHHKSSHGCKTCPHSEKVVKYLRKRKYWACGFCAALHPSRERHVEHVARHFESGKTKADWQHSRVIYGLLHQPLIHEAWKDIMAKQPEFGGRLPSISWNPTNTGRQQGFMENECRGQLQDLLEFFSGSSTEAESIAAMAYESADRVFPQQVFGSPIETNPNVLSYPTPPETTLSPVTPGSSIPAPAPAPAQQPAMMEPTSPTPQFPVNFGNSQQIMTQAMFNVPQPAPQQSVQGALRRSSLERPLPPPPSSASDMVMGMGQPQPQSQQAPPAPPALDLAYLQTGDMVMDDCWSMQSYATTVVDNAIPAPSQVSSDWSAMMAFNYNQQQQS